jgi:hypothetical protein
MVMNGHCKCIAHPQPCEDMAGDSGLCDTCKDVHDWGGACALPPSDPPAINDEGVKYVENQGEKLKEAIDEAAGGLIYDCGFNHDEIDICDECEGCRECGTCYCGEDDEDQMDGFC